MCRSGRRTTLQVQNFKFLKEMGLKKPAFLPDFGKVQPPLLEPIADLGGAMSAVLVQGRDEECDHSCLQSYALKVCRRRGRRCWTGSTPALMHRLAVHADCALGGAWIISCLVHGGAGVHWSCIAGVFVQGHH